MCTTGGVGISTYLPPLTHLQAAEYRADLVLFLRRGTENVLGIIVEIQLHRDEDKPYSWPAYVANLRARHRCPVCLLVVTVEEAVESWAGRLSNSDRVAGACRGCWDRLLCPL